MKPIGLTTLFVVGWACAPYHAQIEGNYQFTATEILRDDCALLPNLDALWDGNLQRSGEVVWIQYGLFAIPMVGMYKANADRFSADGSAANLQTEVLGMSCLLDVVQIHVDAATLRPDVFTGTLRVEYQASRLPDRCVCELWTTYRAQLW